MKLPSLLIVIALVGSLWAAEGAGRSENFEDFFIEFMENAEYQKSRIQFPVLSLSFHMESDIADSSFIDKAHWRFNEFKSLRTGTQVRQFDNFARTTRDTDERVISLIGNDNGILFSYFFLRIEGRWFLVKILDESS
jgi:hypothetical protein